MLCFVDTYYFLFLDFMKFYSFPLHSVPLTLFRLIDYQCQDLRVSKKIIIRQVLQKQIPKCRSNGKNAGFLKKKKKKTRDFFSCLLYSLIFPETAKEGADIGQQSQLTPSPCWNPDHLFALQSSSILSIPHGPVWFACDRVSLFSHYSVPNLSSVERQEKNFISSFGLIYNDVICY